jgi:hypothetical protein
MVESSAHLLLHCYFAHKIGHRMFRWLGLVVMIPSSLSSLFQILSGSAVNTKVKRDSVKIVIESYV